MLGESLAILYRKNVKKEYDEGERVIKGDLIARGVELESELARYDCEKNLM